jgi:hypothetical protein
MILNVDERDACSAEERLTPELAAYLSRSRRSRNLSHLDLAEVLPAGFTADTVRALETGETAMTVAQLVDLAAAFGDEPGETVHRACQRAGVALEVVPLRVDLRRIATAGDPRIMPWVEWARVQLELRSDPVAELSPDEVTDLAWKYGASREGFAVLLATYGPPTVHTARPGGGGEERP